MIEQIYIPTKIYFGVDSLENIRELKEKYHNIFVVCYGKLPHKFQQEVKEYLGDSLEQFLVGEIPGELTEEKINALLARKTPQTDCVTGIGGGSILDAAKVLAIQVSKLSDFSEGSDVLPIITIPTTAGTGSETSKGAVVKQGGMKRTIRSEKILPTMAIVDPRLSQSLPWDLTLYTGFDALTHTIETFMSKKSTPFSRMVSEQTIKDLFSYLPKAKKEFEEEGEISLPVRGKLSFVAMLQGINLAHSSTCIPHRIQYALSTLSEATHAQGLASIYRAWLRVANPNIGGFAHQDIIRLMDDLGVTIRLSDIGINKGDIDGIMRKIEGNLELDPCYLGEKTIRDILEGSL